MCSHNNTIEVIDWGRTEYKEALNLQKKRVEQRHKKLCNDALIFTEHAPVFTVGMRKNAAQHLIWSESKCKGHGITVIMLIVEATLPIMVLARL